MGVVYRQLQMRHGLCPPDLSCSVPFLLSLVLWSTQQGLMWVCAWPGNNRVLSIISSSLLVSDYSFCCSLSPWTSVLQEKQVCGICLLNLSPCPLTPTPHQCQLLVKADSALCRGFLILQIYLSTLCNITWILQ